MILNSADESKQQNIIVEPLFETRKKTIQLFIDRRLRCSTWFLNVLIGLKENCQV
jgi:hypothetical protein